MSRSIYNYTIEVLKKVSFDAQLFSKEVNKALLRLLPYEKEELRLWIKDFIIDKPQLQPSLLMFK